MRRNTIILLLIFIASLIFFVIDQRKTNQQNQGKASMQQVLQNQIIEITMPEFDPKSSTCINITLAPTTRNIDGKTIQWQTSIDLPFPSKGKQSQIPTNSWDRSVDKNAMDYTLNLRNKLGTQKDTFDYIVLVQNPDGTASTAQEKVTGDTWSYIHYPTNFPGGNTKTKGIYTVIYTANRQVIACDGFVIE